MQDQLLKCEYHERSNPGESCYLKHHVIGFQCVPLLYPELQKLWQIHKLNTCACLQSQRPTYGICITPPRLQEHNLWQNTEKWQYMTRKPWRSRQYMLLLALFISMFETMHVESGKYCSWPLHHESYSQILGFTIIIATCHVSLLHWCICRVSIFDINHFMQSILIVAFKTKLLIKKPLYTTVIMCSIIMRVWHETRRSHLTYSQCLYLKILGDTVSVIEDIPQGYHSLAYV